MMKINIVSIDKRYVLLNECLLNAGYNSKVCMPESCDKCDALILSARKEIDDNGLCQVLSKIDSETLVLCGNDERVKNYFSGTVIDYTNLEHFVSENALLTAEGTISYLHRRTESSL